jgi:hypothetical protein
MNLNGPTTCLANCGRLYQKTCFCVGFKFLMQLFSAEASNSLKMSAKSVGSDQAQA